MTKPTPTPTRPPKHAYLSFTAQVSRLTSEVLLSTIDNLVNGGTNQITLMLSTPGGSIFHGITVYNHLKGLPIELTTYNIGTVNSIGNVIYLAGAKRYACKTSSFMFHGAAVNFQEKAALEEKGLREKLDLLINDQGLMIDIISERTKIKPQEVKRLFLQMKFLRASEARSRGIVHVIRDIKIPKGVPVHQFVFKR